MSKFHVGDRVRISQADYAGNGATGTVTNYRPEDEPWAYLVQFDRWQDRVGHEDTFKEEHLRPADIVPQNDVVNHPSHYTSYKGIEVIQLTEQMNFNRGNAVKYIARAGLKNPDTEIEDLKKAAWYLQREINRLEANK